MTKMPCVQNQKLLILLNILKLHGLQIMERGSFKNMWLKTFAQTKYVSFTWVTTLTKRFSQLLGNLPESNWETLTWTTILYTAWDKKLSLMRDFLCKTAKRNLNILLINELECFEQHAADLPRKDTPRALANPCDANIDVFANRPFPACFCAHGNLNCVTNIKP